MARAKEQNDLMREGRKAKILSGALRLFATRGLAATKISDIARETAMSQGLVYHYYRSKEEIFAELIGSAFAKLNAACADLEKDQSAPKQKILMALKALIDGLNESQETARYHLLIAMASASDITPPPVVAIIESQNKYPYDVMERIFEQGQNDGTIRKDHTARDLAVLFWTTILGLAIYKSSHGADSFNPDISLITKLFFAHGE